MGAVSIASRWWPHLVILLIEPDGSVDPPGVVDALVDHGLRAEEDGGRNRMMAAKNTLKLGGRAPEAATKSGRSYS